jgi:CheY-like chemotaxis protein
MRQALQSKRILVVDDNLDAAESLALLLRLKGHDVRHAHEAGEALEIAREFQPEVGLLDIGLPGMDGYDLATLLRRQASGRDILLIAITGYGQDEDRRKALDAGFDEHLTKPVDPPKLALLIAGGAGDDYPGATRALQSGGSTMKAASRSSSGVT